MHLARCLAAAVAVVVLTGCEPMASEAQPVSAKTAVARAPEVVKKQSPAPARKPPARKAAAAMPLLRAAAGGDGDSWKDTRGVEYRLGMVNAPELSECYGPRASAKRKQLTAAGFRARSYTTDSHGRKVSVVTLADGRNLNVWLARNGFVDDTYFAQFRHEDPALAVQLASAFAAAKRARVGLWGACSVARSSPVPAAAPQPLLAQPAGTCDPSYPSVCIPPGPPDLDCGQISHRRFAVRAPDPHRFDADDDGVGCESG